MGVLNWKTYHDDASSIMSLKINALCYFPSGYSQKYASSAIIASLSIFFETVFSFNRIFLFYIYILIFNKFVNDSSFIPVFQNMLHVDI